MYIVFLDDLGGFLDRFNSFVFLVSICIYPIVYITVVMSFDQGIASPNQIGRGAEHFNLDLCVICQKDDKLPVTSAPKGRESVKRAAEIRNDIVTKRLRSIEACDLNAAKSDDNMLDATEIDAAQVEQPFVYHNTNMCFKGYTHTTLLKTISKKRNADVNSSFEVEPLPIPCVDETDVRSTRTKSVPRAPPSTHKDPIYLPCVICGKVKLNKETDKCRVSEYDSAIKLIRAIQFFKDDVYTRVADLFRDTVEDSAKTLLAADAYCHKKCYRLYMVRYDRERESDASKASNISNIKRVLFTRAVPHFNRILHSKQICSQGDLVDLTMSLLEEGESLASEFRKRDLKQMLISYYGDRITIAPSNRVNESDVVFSSDLSAAELAVKLQNLDSIKEAASALRKTMMDTDFGLQDSFCDSADLKEAWENNIMTAPLVTFFSILFNIPRYKLYRSSTNVLDEVMEHVEHFDDN